MVSSSMDLSLLPYRCPRCEKNADFTTLDGLRQHLAEKHSYSGASSRRKPTTSGRKSPLTESFLRQRELLEQQLRDARAAEANHRLTRTTDRPTDHSLLVTPTPCKPMPAERLGSFDNQHHSTPINRSPDPNLGTSCRYINPKGDPRYGLHGNTLDGSHLSNIESDPNQFPRLRTSTGYQNPQRAGEPNISQPLSVGDLHSGRLIDGSMEEASRKSGILLSEALTQARNHVDSLKKTADDVVERQAQLIQVLRAELKNKDRRLESVKGQLEILRSERRTLLGKVTQLHRDSDKQVEKMATLSDDVREKDRLIEKKEKEVHDLSVFLDEASNQESEAKAQLELYIAGLAQRAERAEKALRQLGLNENGIIPIDQTRPKINFQSSPSSKENSPANTRKVLRERQEQRPKVKLSSGSVISQYATPTLTPLSIATPPSAPPTLKNVFGNTDFSPMGTQSASSAPSQFATSGYFTFSTPASIQSTPLKELNNRSNIMIDSSSPSISPAPYNLSFVRPQSFDSPLSPGEIVVEHLNWPIQEKGTEIESGRSLEDEGVEPMLSDSQGSLSGQSSPCTLLPYFERSNTSILPPGANEGFMTSSPGFKHSDHNESALSRLGRDRRHEVLFTIFKYLDTATLSRMSLVCREWRTLSRHPVLWRRVCLLGCSVSSQFLTTLSEWCTQLQSLTLKGLSGRPQRNTEDNEMYRRNLRGSLEVGLESLLYAGRDTLQSLSIIDCSNVLTERSLWLASCHCRYLERVAYISDLDPAGSEVIWALGAGCRDIQTLIIPPKYPNAHPSRFTDRCLQKVAACWPQLMVLCIGGREITVKGLTTLAKICTSLQVLELDHMCEVTEDDVINICKHGFRNLKTLEFSFTPVTPRALLTLVGNVPSLRCVRIRLSIMDYFHDIHDPEHRRQYQDIMSKLKLVQSLPGMSDVIHITDYSEDVR